MRRNEYDPHLAGNGSLGVVASFGIEIGNVQPVLTDLDSQAGAAFPMKYVLPVADCIDEKVTLWCFCMCGHDCDTS